MKTCGRYNLKPDYSIIAAGFLLPLLINSCEENTDWDIRSMGRFPVADCIITNEMKYQQLKLYQSADQLNEVPAGISGASVEISNGIISAVFHEDPTTEGLYISDEPFRAAAGNIYRLIIGKGEYADTAFADMTGVTPLNDIQIIPSDSLFRFVYSAGSQASMMEVYYDWSDDPAYCRRYGACQASEVYYNLDNIDAEKEFAPDRKIILFPKNTRIIRRKYSLSLPHQNFIRAMLLETEWRGGLFDAEQGNVPTNFHHGVRGWFAACAVVSDTTTVAGF